MERVKRERETVIINMEVVRCPLLVSSVTALILFLILTVLILNEAQEVRFLQDV